MASPTTTETQPSETRPTDTRPAETQPAQTPPTATLNYDVGIQRLAAATEDVLRRILDRAGIPSARVTSTGRTVEDQARVMFDNIRDHGVQSQLDRKSSPSPVVN